MSVLAKAINEGDVSQKILGNYQGDLSLGIGKDGDEYVFCLQVEGDDVEQFPNAVKVAEGDTQYNVRILVEGNFQPPVASSC